MLCFLNSLYCMVFYWTLYSCVQWCPPCRALLPELRKASVQLAGQIRFGTLDCTIHHNLCSTVSPMILWTKQMILRWAATSTTRSLRPLCASQYNIQAYPTTVIFNGSSVHEYEGHHSADGILEFIQVSFKAVTFKTMRDAYLQLILFIASVLVVLARHLSVSAGSGQSICGGPGPLQLYRKSKR